MNQLSAEEIVNIEIKLLQSSGRTLTTLHKHLLTNSSGNQSKIFVQFDKKNLSTKLRKMLIANVQSMGSDSNANLRAFSIIILKLIFRKQVDEEILSILKSHLHSIDINLQKIRNIPKTNFYYDLQRLCEKQCRKILVEFLYSLKSSQEQNKIQIECKKYPLALELMVILWRAVLLKLKVPEAENYSKKISTTATYQILFQLMDVFYCKSGRLYLLKDENLFIQNGYENEHQQFIEQIVFGDYYENEDQYKAQIMKNMETSLIFNSDSLKIASSAFNSCQFNIKCQTLQTIKSESVDAVNPFDLVLPKGSMVFDSTHSYNNSNRSLKGSNAFEKKYYNFSSNRSQASVNLEDSQCDNPTPSFNQIAQDQLHDSFRPRDDLNDEIVNPKSPRCANNSHLMKQSATILPAKSKLLRSSLFEDTRFYHQPKKGSVQLEQQTRVALGLKSQNEIYGLETGDSPVNQPMKFSPFFNILQKSLQDKKSNNNEKDNFQKNLSYEDKKCMKRSQSEKNSMIRQSQTMNQEESGRPSLFSINCKKLKTSMQINDTDFLSQKNFSYGGKNNYPNQNFKDLCENSSYSCSCYSVKIQKNRIVSNAFNFSYQPLNEQKANFKKKTNHEIVGQNILFDKSLRTKTKLNDEFFKNLKAKREEQRLKNPNPKNKSDPKCKGEKSFRKPHFIKYSQFIKMDDRSVSKSKTPDNSERIVKKKVFPTSFKRLDTFFSKGPDHQSSQTGMRKFKSSKQDNKSISSKSVNQIFISKKPLNGKQVHKRNPLTKNIVSSFESKGFPLYSTPTTPAALRQNSQQDILIKNRVNESFERYSNFEPLSNGGRKIGISYFSPHSSNGFGKNDNLFYNPQENTKSGHRI